MALLRSDSRQTLYRAAGALSESRRVCVVRGDNMRTWDALFAEVSAAFQFFIGWGWNLDAMFECLIDLDLRFTRDSRGMVIVSAEQVLRDEPGEQLDKFVAGLRDAGDEGLRTFLAPLEEITWTYERWRSLVPSLQAIDVENSVELSSLVAQMTRRNES